MRTLSQNKVEKIIEAIEEAKECWDGWDWDLPFYVESDKWDDYNNTRVTYELHADGLTTYRDVVKTCKGDLKAASELWSEVKAFKKKVEEAVARARAYGDEAIEALREGRYEDALDALKAASSTENDFGDDPCWSVPLSELEKALEEEDLLPDWYY